MDNASTARHRDPVTGITETVGYLGDPGRRYLVYAHQPPGAPRLGIVICPPLLGDFVANYRREVVCARRLAESGVAVWRFQYLGTGNSEGSWCDASFSTLRECAEDVARYASEVMGDVPVGMVGTRMSAFVAAACIARQPPAAPLILWDPVIDPKSHFRQAFRAESMRNIKEKWANSPSVSDMMEIMTTKGSVDVLGYSLPLSLYQDALELQLAALLGQRNRPVLIVTMAAASKQIEDFTLALQEAGFDVTLRVAETEESWWFDQEERIDAGPIVETTVDWLIKGRETQ